MPDNHPSLGVARGTVEIQPADPAWAELARAEITRLRQHLDATGLPPLAFAHIGSTSVPGLPAKPILDLMAGHTAHAAADDYIAVLQAAGYAPRGRPNDPDTLFFARGPDARRTHYLHLALHGGPSWREHLAFRDRLRSDPALAREYAALKASLARAYPDDRAAYTEAKTGFVTAALRAAGDGID